MAVEIQNKIWNQTISCLGHGESGSVDIPKYQDEINGIKLQLSTFIPANIYNCDESGLYLKVMSKRSLDRGPIRGRKIVRDTRVSILFCTNADGSDKRKLLVLCKSIERPHESLMTKCSNIFSLH